MSAAWTKNHRTRELEWETGSCLMSLHTALPFSPFLLLGWCSFPPAFLALGEA